MDALNDSRGRALLAGRDGTVFTEFLLAYDEGRGASLGRRKQDVLQLPSLSISCIEEGC